jgi:hypothetical protein
MFRMSLSSYFALKASRFANSKICPKHARIIYVPSCTHSPQMAVHDAHGEHDLLVLTISMNDLSITVQFSISNQVSQGSLYNSPKDTSLHFAVF